jgi:hypothetical protein
MPSCCCTPHLPAPSVLKAWISTAQNTTNPVKKVVSLAPREDVFEFLATKAEELKADPTIVPKLHGIQHDNHHELAVESFENSLAFLKALHHKELKQGPIVLIALGKANELLGISLGHMERTLKSGEKVYTPVAKHIEDDKKDQDGHSALNWIVSFTQKKGVANALMSIQDKIIPPTVKRLDTVAEIKDYTPAAIPFYESFGLKTMSDYAHERPIPRKSDSGPMPQFNSPELHGMPMSGSRADFSAKASRISKELAWTNDCVSDFKKIHFIKQPQSQASSGGWRLFKFFQS